MGRRFLILVGLVVVLGGVFCWVSFGDFERGRVGGDVGEVGREESVGLEDRILVQEDLVADYRNRAVAILEKPGHLVDGNLPNREEVLLGMMRGENRELYDEYMEVWARERDLLEEMRRDLIVEESVR